MSIEQVRLGVLRFLENKIIPSLVDWQELIVATFADMIFGDTETFRGWLQKPFFRTVFLLHDGTDEMDAGPLLRSLKKTISARGEVSVKIPLLGKYTFRADDVEALNNEIAMAV